MPRNSTTGVYEAPTSSVNPAVPNTVISSTDFNAMLTDVETALSTTDATTRVLWARAGQVQDDAINWCGTAGGTADALTLTPTVPLAAYATGGRFAFLTGASANTTSTPTVNVSGLGAKTIVRRDGTALTAGDLPASTLIEIRYDGTNFRLPSITAASVSGGGTVTSTAASFALTSSSNRVQSVTFTADGQSVTLPDATTLSVGGPTFIISNAGSRPFGVRANGGTMLTAVPAGATAEFSLADNGTAAGTWAVEGNGLSPALTICDTTLASTLVTAVQVAIRLSDTLSLHFARNSSGHPFVFAVDSTPGASSVGTPVLIVASNLDVEHGFRISATKAMIKVEGTSSNVYNITVSGTTCTVSSAATAAVFDFATFTGGPFITALGANSDVFVAIDITGTTVRAQAVDCSGTNPSAGSSVNISALGTGTPGLSGVFRVTDTTAVAFYVDDTGAAGTPFSIRAVVLSLSGTTITVNTPAGLNDVISSTGTNGPPVCEHAAGLYTIGYYQTSGTLLRAVGVTVSGTTVTFGTPLTVETASLGNQDIGQYNANRFQPNMFPLDATRALFTYGFTTGSTPSRHAVLTNSAGTLTAGTILAGLWTDASGGNFPQASDGFLALEEISTSSRLSNVVISGTTLTVTGTALPPGVSITESATQRFGLSGGIRGIRQNYQDGPAISRTSMWNVFRLTQGAGPRYLGAFDLPNFSGSQIPVEVAPNKAAFISGTATSGSLVPGTPILKVAILEFAA